MGKGDCPSPLGDGLASQGDNTDNFGDNSMVLWYTEVNIPSVTITGVFDIEDYHGKQKIHNKNEYLSN